MFMGFFASPIGMFLCVALGLTLTTLNVLDLVAIKKNRYAQLKEQRAIRAAHKVADLATVAMFLLFLVSFVH